MITELEVEEILRRRFEKYLEPLNQISKDTANNEILLNRPDTFFNYDKIVRESYEDQGGYTPKSPDMILFRNNTVVFVEFKNGKIHSRDKDQLKLKAVQGGIIVLHHIVSKEKSDLDFFDTLKLKKSYVVVYNTGKNPVNEIHDRIYGRTSRFGLHIYENTFFYKVRTVSPGTFSHWLDGKEKD